MDPNGNHETHRGGTRSQISDQSRSLERAGLVGAWLDAALRSERAQLFEQLERQHAAIVAGLEAKLEGSGVGTPLSVPRTPRTPLQMQGAAEDGLAREVHHEQLGRRSGDAAPNPGAAQVQMTQTSVDHGAGDKALSKKKKPAPLDATGADLPSAAAKTPKAHTGIMGKDNMPLSKQICLAPRSMEELVCHPLFETFFALLIISNAVCMALEVQYVGMQSGYDLRFPGAYANAETRWPRARSMIDSIELFFGFWFSMEVVLKVLAYRQRFPCSLWNLFDAGIIGFWLLDKVLGVQGGVNPMVLRLFRLAKVLRMVRVVKFMNALDTLQLLLSSITASVSILLWSSIILSLVMVTCAVMMNYLLLDFMTEEDNDHGKRTNVYRYFGTFSRAMLTMVELTLQNPFPCCRTLVEEVSEGYAVLFILYKIVMGFAVVKVITGVFMHETFKVASTDDELMIMQKERLIEKHTTKMMSLFLEADTSGEGLLSLEEFRDVMKDARVKTWLGAMELDVRDADLLFSMIDGSGGGRDGVISAEELVGGVARLKGSARAIDLAVLTRLCSTLQKAHEGLVLGSSPRAYSQSAPSPATNSSDFGAINMADFAAVARETKGLREGLVAVRRQVGELVRSSEALRVPSGHNGQWQNGRLALGDASQARPDSRSWRRS